MLRPLLLAALLLHAAPPLQARRHPPDLREDDPPRRNTRPAECQFAKQAKELGSTWYADLGPPFGVMYCIKCECIGVQKKRRVVAKVQCRNIKNDCPEPTCDTPVLLPGRCCKSCPGDTNSPDVLLEDSPMIVTAEEEELSMKHFGALLTGRSPLCIRRDDMSPVPVAAGVATGRFTFRRRHLYWSLLLGPSTPAAPRAVLFLDKGGRLLLEHPLKRHPGLHATYEDATDKICGVWRRVPRDYKRLLREGSLYVALIWGDEATSSMDSALSGRINRYPALASEMFSAVLEPEEPPDSLPQRGACDDVRGTPSGWWGATAVVTGAAGAAPSLHVALMYNGVFAPHEARDSTVRLLLQAPDKNLTIIDEVQLVPKPSSEVNIMEVSTPVNAADLRSLTRGRLQLSLESPNAPSLKIRGIIRQRASCEVFQATLMSERLPAEVPATGLAWMYINKDGSLVYDIQIESVKTLPKITLVDDFGKRHSQVEILDTMTGILARPSARIFSPLYDEQLGVHVTDSEKGTMLLRGRLLSRPLPDAVSSGPVLLRRTDQGQPTNTVALAWIAVDSLCGIQYEISVNGGDDGWVAWLESWVLASGAASGAGSHIRMLPGQDGCVLEPSGAELTSLHSGAAYVELRSSDNVTVLLRARLPQISVPPTCLPAVTWNSDNDLGPNNYIPTHVNPPPDNSLMNPASCFFAGRFYEDGAQWTSTESCTMCGCVHGTVRCDPVRCPPVHCAVPTITRPGECCPICTNSSVAEWNASRGSVAGCYLAGQFHAAGASWHPYLVPGGYDTCAVCTCDYTSLVVRCPRVSCPSLRCPEKEAYRPDKKACCRVCPEVKEKKDEGTLRDEGTPKTAAEILAEGGCKFPEGPLPNGKEVHPSIASHGEQKCVTCRCKDGVLTCVRARCGRGACSRRRRADPCCACRRHRRHRQPRLDPPS